MSDIGSEQRDGEREWEWNYRERKREGRQQNHERQRDPEGQREQHNPPRLGFKMHPTPLVFGSAWSSGCSNDQPTPPAPPDRAGGLGTTTHPTQLPIAVPGAGRTTKQKQVSGLLPLQASKREFPRSFCSVGPPHMCWDPSATPQTPLPPVIWHYACDLCAFETKSHNRSEPLGGPE